MIYGVKCSLNIMQETQLLLIHHYPYYWTMHRTLIILNQDRNSRIAWPKAILKLAEIAWPKLKFRYKIHVYSCWKISCSKILLIIGSTNGPWQRVPCLFQENSNFITAKYINHAEAAVILSCLKICIYNYVDASKSKHFACNFPHSASNNFLE